MSYPRDMDEIPADELRAELTRRQRLQAQGRCDYCERDLAKCDASPCRFPRRDP